MDKIKNYVIIILIFLILTGFCALMTLYIKERNNPLQTIISTQTEVRIDTIKINDTLLYPVPIEVLKPVYDTLIDTQYVVQDYYTGKIYEYNYKDTNFSIKAAIMIHKNALVSLIPEYEIYRKTITITNNIEVVKPPKFALSVGCDVGALFNTEKTKLLFFISASIQRERNQYNVGYDPFNRAFKVGYKYTIIYK